MLKKVYFHIPAVRKYISNSKSVYKEKVMLYYAKVTEIEVMVVN